MRICLVPYPSDAPWELDLPVGPLTLATLLEQAGHQVTIIDPAWAPGSTTTDESSGEACSRAVRLLQAESPDLVGFSTICSSYPRIIEWARHYRQLAPNTPIVLGGPQATATARETLQAFPWIDWVLRGEAENSIVPLVTCLEQGGDWATVPGLTWRQADQVVCNPDAPVVTDLDELPPPAYHLYPMEQLVQQAGEGNGRHKLGLEAGRGCPFNCAFCSTSHFFHRRYRAKSAGHLIQEMSDLHNRYGASSFSLLHDLFTCNRKYVLEFCRRMREQGLHEILTWGCSSRIDTVDETLLAEMAAAGCVHVFFGVETGSARMQKLIHKNLDLRRVRPIIRAALSHHLDTTASFICGFPQEREEDLSETLALILDLVRMGVQEVQLNVLAPLVGSELYLEFHDSLCCDHSFSDISYSRLSPAEQQLVRDYPHIFASFHHFETPHLGLNRQSIRALSSMIHASPRLLAALEGGGIELASVFRRWPDWRQSHRVEPSSYYYRQTEFRQDFYRFLQEMLNAEAPAAPELDEVINYHALCEQVGAGQAGQPVMSHRFRCDVLAWMRHWIDQERLAETARQPTTYLFSASNGQVLVKRLNPTLQQLVGISEERRQVEDAVCGNDQAFCPSG